jgi:hypothetical protein
MHIPETGNTPSLTPDTVAPQSGNPPLSPAPSSVSLTPPAPLLSDRLASLLAETGLELSPAQFEDLAVELASLGFSPAELDREGAVRAVFLRRNSVPLTAALLNAPVSPESTALFRQAATLLEEALAVLGSRSVSSEARASVETLARDLETLLGGNAALYG